MEDYPKTLSEFESRFSSEESCRDYLYKLRWPTGFCCPHCMHTKAWPVGTVLYQCAHCNYQVSVVAGTIFHGTHKSLMIWFRAIWWLVGQKNGASALGLKNILGLEHLQMVLLNLLKIKKIMKINGGY